MVHGRWVGPGALAHPRRGKSVDEAIATAPLALHELLWTRLGSRRDCPPCRAGAGRPSHGGRHDILWNALGPPARLPSLPSGAGASFSRPPWPAWRVSRRWAGAATGS